ncbi:TetR/AcrR family transcriptional regulator [uncultured Sulfitobacter sp.]|uniref:TetR/AcrR family transcriptional regulator n=1 Tax=uncultured Sulfitobacter sp. TaxID=191468 RepID=UPI00260CDD7D|nr:TetR/AcrR family transcriptional regulator [uncultured Sulfitobacter sp.]
MMTKIAGGLEQAFAARGFTEPSVEDLRDAAGVSMRTLYKYAQSRDAMIRLALEHRHQRYLAQVFGHPTDESVQSLSETLDRIAGWMQAEASHGCLFHAAVASSPTDPALRKLLEKHKEEVSQLASTKARTDMSTSDLLVIIEGLTQAWPLSKDAALASAKRLACLAEAASN